MYHHERHPDPPPPFLLSLFSLPHMFLLHVYIVLCYARPTTLTLLLLLLCACSSQAFHLSCSLSTCLLPFSSFSVTVSMLAAPIQCGPPPSPPANRAEPGCGSIRALVGASLRHCHLVNKSSANVTVVLAWHIDHVLPVVMWLPKEKNVTEESSWSDFDVRNTRIVELWPREPINNENIQVKFT